MSDDYDALGPVAHGLRPLAYDREVAQRGSRRLRFILWSAFWTAVGWWLHDLLVL